MTLSLRSGKTLGASDEEDEEVATSPKQEEVGESIPRRKSARLGGTLSVPPDAPLPDSILKSNKAYGHDLEGDAPPPKKVRFSLPEDAKVTMSFDCVEIPVRGKGKGLATTSNGTATTSNSNSNPQQSSTSNIVESQTSTAADQTHAFEAPLPSPTPLTAFTSFLAYLSPYSRLASHAAAFFKLGIQSESALMATRREDAIFQEKLGDEGVPPFERVILFRGLERERERRSSVVEGGVQEEVTMEDDSELDGDWGKGKGKGRSLVAD